MKKDVPFLIGIALIAIAAFFAYVMIASWLGARPRSYIITQQPNAATSTLAPYVSEPGDHCGGNTVHPFSCTVGYHCAPDPTSHLPFGDVSGICIADKK